MSSLPRPLKWPPIFPLEKGLVAWYTFDDRSGAVLRDRSGKGNHGVITCATWVAGLRGSGLNFNGSTNWVLMSLPSNANEAFTLSIYVKDFVATGSRKSILAAYTGSNPASLNYAAITFQKEGSTQAWGAYIFNTDGSITVLEGSPITAPAFVTFVRSSGDLSLYFNGILSTSTALTKTIRTFDKLSIAYSYQGVAQVKYASRCSYFNRVLSAAEIKRLAESELTLVRH